MLTVDEFESHIKYFLNKGYNFINLNTTPRFKASKKEALITIDDGYEDNYKYVFPVLKKYNIPASIFLATNYIGKTMELGGVELPMMTKEQIKEMYDSKLVYFGSHTHNHVYFTELKSHEEAENDLKECNRVFEKILGYKPKYFVYPKGRISEKYRHLYEKYFDFAIQGSGCVKEIEDTYKINRIEILHNDSKLKKIYHFKCLHWMKRIIK